MRYFADWLRGVGERIEDVTRGTVEQWMADLRIGGVRSKTVKIRVGVIRYFYSWLHEHGYIAQNPLAHLKSIKAQVRLPRPISQEAVTLIIAAANGFRGIPRIYAERDVALVETLYASGGRRDEILGLDVGDLDLSGWSVLLRGKGGVERVQPISESAVKALRRWLELRDDLLRRWTRPHERAVFCTWKGRMKRSQLQQMLDRLTKAAGLPHCHPHQFRHGLATNMLEAGMDLRYVQELLGHASIKSTEVYTRVSKERLRFEYMKAMGQSRKTETL